MRKVNACELCKGNCMGCYYSDYCETYQSTGTTTPIVTLSENGLVVSIDNPINIINCTPHLISIYDNENNVVMKLEPSGNTPRITVGEVKTVGTINGIIPITVNSYGELKDLPEPKQNTIYIVSKMIAEAEASKGNGRKDLYIVNDTVRDNNNRIIGCKSLSQI